MTKAGGEQGRLSDTGARVPAIGDKGRTQAVSEQAGESTDELIGINDVGDGTMGLGGLETRVGCDRSPYPDKESEETDFIEWWLLSMRDKEKELA